MEEIKVIYEDKNFIAVSKPSGLLVHAVRGSNMRHETREATLVDWLLERYPEVKNVGDDTEVRPGIVHRLDRETSGVMIIPRNQKYFEYLKSLFKSRAIKKTYIALVGGKVFPKEGVIEKPISIKTGSVKRTTRSGKMTKEAITDYKVIRYKGEDGDFESLLFVVPRTGRTHQIRVHLSSIGHPVLGDKLYGGKKEKGRSRLMLHAYSLEFTSEEGKRIKIESEPPPELST